MFNICNWPNNDNYFNDVNNKIKILYIDSGCDIYHDELKGNILIDECLSFVDNDDTLLDYTGHGTQIVSAIVGKNKLNGLYKKCDIVMYKITNIDGVTKFDWLYRALKKAIDNDYKVINISYSGITTDKEIFDEFQELVDIANKKNIHICSSVDNYQEEKAMIIPSSLDNVYSIGSLNFNGSVSSLNSSKYTDYYTPGGDDFFEIGDIKSFILLANSTLSEFNIGSEMGLNKNYTLNFGNSIACSYFSCCIAIILSFERKNNKRNVNKKFIDQLYSQHQNLNAILSTKEIIKNEYL